MSSENGVMLAAVVFPGGVFAAGKKNKWVVGMNHAHSSVLKATAQSKAFN